MKIFLFKIYLRLDNFICSLFAADDLRNNRSKTSYIKVVMVPETNYKASAPLYHYPKNHKPIWVDIFERGFTVPEVWYVELNNAYLISKGLLLNEKKRIFLESAFFQREYLNKLRIAHLLLKNLFVNPKQQYNNIVPLSNRLSNNYFHWTAESLPRIALLLEHNGALINSHSIAINEDAPSYVVDSLCSLIGWPKQKIVKLPVDGIAKTSSCIMVSYEVTRDDSTSMFYAYPPTIFRRLNQLALENIFLEIENSNSCFIISRARTKSRRLVNETLLINRFEGIHLSIVYLEELDFVEQVRLFQNATLIVAPHGAGLTNLIYCNKETVVIELFPVNRDINQTSSFHQISKAIGLRYHILMPTPINTLEDMEADEEMVEQIGEILRSYNLMGKQ